MSLFSVFSETFVQGLTGYSQTESGNGLVPSCASHGFGDEVLLKLFQGRQSLRESHRDTLPLHLLGLLLVRRRRLLEDVGLENIHGELARPVAAD